jgi:hypothetical protein
MMEPGAQLWFHTWHQIEYNADFGFVELSNGSSWQILDALTGASGWTQKNYDLSSFGGTPLKLRFHFSSDGSQWAEGWYIDDLVFGHAYPVQEEVGPRPPREEFNISISRPVFSDRTGILLSLPESNDVTITAYDLSGRTVSRIHRGVLDRGTHHLVWTGTGAEGRNLESGVYFLAVDAGSRNHTRKVVLIR